MSWSTSANGIDLDGIPTMPEPTFYEPESEAEARAAFNAAREAAEKIAGVICRPGDRINVTLAGHANPEQAPRPGWSNQSVAITLYQVPQESL